MRLETERLELVAIDAALADALGEPAEASRQLSASIPPGWPDEELAGLLAAREPARSGFGPWVVVDRRERAVVGSAGFVAEPAEDGSVELGFGMHPGWRNRGYASEAARGLVEWALAQRPVARVVARCEPANAASIRVLEKTGMTRVGEAGGMLLWEMRR